jgi:hypothetical protein
VFDWIDAVEELAASGTRSFTRLGQGYDVDRSKAHMPRSSVTRVAQQPGLPAVLAHLQPQARAVAVAAGLACAIHLQRRQSSHLQPSDSVRAGLPANAPAYVFATDYSGRPRKVSEESTAIGH